MCVALLNDLKTDKYCWIYRIFSLVAELKTKLADLLEPKVFTLSEPMKQLEADLKNHVVVYDNNPILKWCLANTQAKVDINGNIQPCKLNSKYKRIDGAVALIIAYAVLNRFKKDYETMTN